MSVPLHRIWTVDPLRDDRWSDLVKKHPSTSVFHTRGWLSALHSTYGYTPVAFTLSPPERPLTNALVFCRVQSWLTGSRLVSLPFSDHCEPLVESQDELDRLCEHVSQLRLRERLKYVELRSANTRMHFGKDFGSATVYHLHRLDLRPSLEMLRKTFHKDCIQRKILRAEREPLGYEAGRSPKLIQHLYELLQLTRARHHLPPQPVEWFTNLIASMGKDILIRIAYKDENPIAGILTLDHAKTTVYKYGGSNVVFNSLGATAMLFWRAIQDAKLEGREEFDWGRSDIDNPGLITFKERWGAVSSILTTYRTPLSVATSSSRPQGQMRLAKKIFSRLPSHVLTLAGRFLYRHVG